MESESHIQKTPLKLIRSPIFSLHELSHRRLLWPSELLEPSGDVWSHLEPSEDIWKHLEPSGGIWYHLESTAAISSYLDPSESCHRGVSPYVVIWFDSMLFDLC